MRKHSSNATKAPQGGRTKATRYTADEQRSLEGRVVSLAITGVLRTAGHQARRRHRKLGIPVTQKVGSKILKVHADGRTEVLGEVSAPRYVLPDDVIVVGEP